MIDELLQTRVMLVRRVESVNDLCWFATEGIPMHFASLLTFSLSVADEQLLDLWNGLVIDSASVIPPTSPLYVDYR